VLDPQELGGFSQDVPVLSAQSREIVGHGEFSRFGDGTGRSASPDGLVFY